MFRRALIIYDHLVFGGDVMRRAGSNLLAEPRARFDCLMLNQQVKKILSSIIIQIQVSRNTYFERLVIYLKVLMTLKMFYSSKFVDAPNIPLFLI